MKFFKLIFVISILLVSATVFAEDNKKVMAVRTALQEIISVNKKYTDNFDAKVSEDTRAEQTPNSTVVLCSDSRVAIRSFVQSPEGNVFSIRDIGNQITTAEGSVTYGIEYLHTPMLLIVGHSGCGAIKAAMQGYQPKDPTLDRELKTLYLDPKGNLNDNIVANVNAQVRNAVNKYQEKVDAGDLVVIGMVYDLHNDFGYGYGSLIFVNINNDANLNADKSPYIQGLTGINILK